MVILRIIKENFKAVIKKFLKSKYYVQSSYFQKTFLMPIRRLKGDEFQDLVWVHFTTAAAKLAATSIVEE
ncbi:unnamed protein product [Rhizophagus irregularis]|uniref:Uncharacterized protein n=1 Tax=Rhizophagus irregularis TaxID=588596 RepID=A0A915Z9D5_9GLOM|nr:unnamed protein product [Rhizophagus irregularis]